MQAFEFNSFLLGLGIAILPVITVWLKDELRYRREKQEREIKRIRQKIENHVIPVLTNFRGILISCKYIFEPTDIQIIKARVEAYSPFIIEYTKRLGLNLTDLALSEIYLPDDISEKMTPLTPLITGYMNRFQGIIKEPEIFLNTRFKNQMLDDLKKMQEILKTVLLQIRQLLGVKPYPIKIAEVPKNASAP